VIQILAVTLGSYAALCVAAFVLQARLVWLPMGRPPREPAALGLPGREVLLQTSDGERLHAWLVAEGHERAAVMICHGNAGHIGDRAALARAYLAMDRAVLLFDYRGFGRSSGTPDEEGTYLDALAAWDWLTGPGGFDAQRAAVHGESLGGAVAIELALRREVGALVLESTFTTLADVGARAYPFLPVRLLARIRYDNLSKLPRIGRPVLFLHSPADQLVPYAHARRLAQALPGSRVVDTGGGHQEPGFLQRREWLDEVSAFLAEHAP
jgi:pimeloyl-ACP methyl ester carboxylesterase